MHAEHAEQVYVLILCAHDSTAKMVLNGVKLHMKVYEIECIQPNYLKVFSSVDVINMH